MSAVGPIDDDTIVAVLGFDGGGPLNFCTIGAKSGKPFITYVSCELAVRLEQLPSEFGRYELLSSCNDERWVRDIVSKIGHMSLEEAYGDGHTLDIGPWVDADDPLQGVVFEKVCALVINGERFGVLRCIGITRPELQFALKRGYQELFERLSSSEIYPHTVRRRESVVDVD